jgi:hypothetical protein
VSTTTFESALRIHRARINTVCPTTRRLARLMCVRLVLSQKGAA